jgi:hypothetical protein
MLRMQFWGEIDPHMSKLAAVSDRGGADDAVSTTYAERIKPRVVWARSLLIVGVRR